jgi:heme/copper-type cytochrome/quinol oxidase subunit 2/mono/diheme cytochrome c family protein
MPLKRAFSSQSRPIAKTVSFSLVSILIIVNPLARRRNEKTGYKVDMVTRNLKRSERLALVFVLIILIGLPVVTLGYQYVLRPRLASHRVIDIRAAVPESGGFQPDAIRVAAGETVTLRFQSVDVTHGVAIGPGLGIDLGHVDPGQIKEVTLTFEEAGIYTFYCNSWCSDNHWRMRGVVEVVDPANPDAPPVSQPDPVIEALATEGVDIDAKHTMIDEEAHNETPHARPSAGRGERIIESLTVPDDMKSAAWRWSHTPEQALALLEIANPHAGEADLTDAIAYWWLSDTSQTEVDQARTLYNKNCAACHGETGDGNGPAASTPAEKPVAFSDWGHMSEMRSDVLYAKIRRGGMGTGMPNFGTVFTPEETWMLVDYLWRLVIDMDSS